MAISKEQLLEIELKAKNGIKLTKDEKQILKENNAEAKAAKGKMSFGQRMMAASKSDYCQLMGDNEVDRFPVRDWIDTGNILYNAQISSDGRKGMPSGRSLQLAGESSTGKTYLGLELLKNAQKIGYFGILYDSEMANNDKEALKARGIDTERLLYIPIDTVENLKTSLLNILDECDAEDRVFVLIDSIGNLSTRKELEDSLEGAATKDMTRPAQLKALFRTVTIKAGIKNVPVVFINHSYAQIGGFMSGGQTIAGGGGPAYNASIISQFTKAQEKGKDGKTSGALITATNIKCRTAKEKTKVKFTIDFESGLTRYSGLELFCTEEGLIKKVNAVKGTKEAPNIPGGYELEIPEYTIDGKFCVIDSNKKVVTNRVKKLNDEFWEEFCVTYLYEYLKQKFSYQTVSEELGLETDEEED